MSKQRTQEQRKKIVDRCVEIEAEGGDVLGYLSTEGYVTPRATWLNMQKFDLKRKDFSDGKPKEKKPVQHRIKFSKDEKQEIDAEAIRILLAGGDADAFLASKGYRNAITIRRNIVHRLKLSDPETHAAIMAARPKQKRKPKPENYITISTKGNPAVKKTKIEPQPVPDAMFRFIPLRDIRKMLKDEQARIGVSDLRRCLEIEDDLRCIERVRQLGIEALRRASA